MDAKGVKQEDNGLNLTVRESSVIFYVATVTSNLPNTLLQSLQKPRRADCLAEMSAAARRTVRSGSGGAIIFSAAAARRDRLRTLLSVHRCGNILRKKQKKMTETLVGLLAARVVLRTYTSIFFAISILYFPFYPQSSVS